MTKFKDTFYRNKFTFHNQQLDYEFQLKKERCCWWLILLLLPLLLLIRCERDITVKCIDERTKSPEQGVDVRLEYTAYYLFKDGHIFHDAYISRNLVTDANGIAHFSDLECSGFSYIFHCLSNVHVVADGCIEKSAVFHFTNDILIELENIDCAVDIVMCIDNTGSMDDLINMVKDNALNFCEDLQDYCEERRRDIKKVRLKIISFGDLKEKPIISSEMFVIPEEREDYRTFVNTIEAKGGGDEDENGLEALALAINTDWVESEYRLRHIIIVYTDAPAHKLENPATHTCYYPENMPNDLDELYSRWRKMNPDARKLVLFAPNDYPWNEISEKWDNVSHKTENLNTILTGTGYVDILEAIYKSL